MNLYIINIPQFYTMLNSDGNTVSGKMPEVGGMPIGSTYASGGQYHLSGGNLFYGSVFHFDHGTITYIVLFNHIQESHILHNGNVISLFCLCQQMTGDFLSGHILVEYNTIPAVGSFSGVNQISITVSLEINAKACQFLHNRLGGTNHNIHGFFIVFIMSRF